MPTLTAQQLADDLGGRVVGDPATAVTGAATATAAGPDDLVFINAKPYVQPWIDGRGRVAVSREDLNLEAGDGRALVLVTDPELAMAQALRHFAPPDPAVPPGVHPTSIVDPTAILGQGVAIGPWCTVGPGVTLGDNCVLHASVHVYDHATLGPGCVLWPGVVIRERCRLGARNLLHANAIVGTDGFGYRPQRTPTGVTLVKMPHLGHVQLGDDCELGACCTVDRGKLTPTVLGHGCKLDNHVQIGHNCRLGNLVVIAGCSALAGSVTVGDGTMIGGQVAIKEHLTIGRGVQLAGGAQLMHHIPDGEVWAGSPAQPIRQTLREIAAIQRLPEFMRAARKFVDG